MNIPRNILLAVAGESPTFRNFLVDNLIRNEEAGRENQIAVESFRAGFIRKARMNKIEAIKDVRNAEGVEKNRFAVWAAERGCSLLPGDWGGDKPGLANAKKFVENVI